MKKRLAETELEKLWAYLSHKVGKKMRFPPEQFMRDSIASILQAMSRGTK